MTKATFTPFLTFPSTAEAAITFYQSVFPGAKITNLVYFDQTFPNILPEMIGKVLNGCLELQGREMFFMDMEPTRPPAFSWATSIYLDFPNEEDFDSSFANLADKGTVMMGPEPVLQFKKVAWVTDKFGVTWQLVCS